MGFRVDRSIVFVGMMGAGKSAVGRAVAALLGVDFADSDEELVRVAGRTIPQIFADEGEQHFRGLETRVIASLLQGGPIVLAVGGGAFMSDINRQNITSGGVSIWLDADVETLWQRVERKGGRPLLEVDDPYSELQRLCRVRYPTYEQADISVRSSDDRTVEEMAADVVDLLLNTDESGVSRDGHEESVKPADGATKVRPR